MRNIKKISISLSLALGLATTATAGMYTVQSGDTVGQIATKLGFKSIKDAGMTVPSGNLAVIYVGDKITYSGSSTVTEESLGLRKTDIYTEDTTTGDKTMYGTGYAGSGYKIKRAFQDAPPMIPHDTDGMLPITISSNQCTSCHAPEVASSMGALPYPVSHMTDFRPSHKFDGKTFTKAVDNMKNEVSIKSTGDKLAGARFNCTQCHAPQSTGKLAVENTFEAVYSNKDGASKSSWVGTRLTNDLDTNGKNSSITEADQKNEHSAAGYLDTKH
jgi:cytochrome c-type protein NapB